jgi:pimeloyl-ACP methyl ester carboxylesterase
MRFFLPALVLLTAAGCAASSSDESGVANADIVAPNQLALASTLPDYCSGPEIVRIPRPASSADAHAKTFEYGFRYKAPSAPNAPVVVFLPGGPGQGSMDSGAEFVPAEWGYLMTDPRGVGCNTLANVPTGEDAARFFQTAELTNDVVAAIRERGLTNYVLFGVSYGTLLGTSVAHQLETEHLPAPKAVVLEGVLGKAFGNTDSDFAGENYIAQFERIRSVLPADVLTELDTSPKPFGLTPEEISRAMMALMPASLQIAASQLYSLSKTADGITDEMRAGALQFLKEKGDTVQLSSPNEIALYRYIACREIMDTVPANDMDIVFQAGHLVRNRAEEGTKCAGLHVTNPYDSAKLQFAAKTYYFLGENDVATPPWQGVYHYEHHEGSAVKVMTSKGGHNSLRFNQDGCASNVMQSIANGAADLDAVLATCPLPVTVEKK